MGLLVQRLRGQDADALTVLAAPKSGGAPRVVVASIPGSVGAFAVHDGAVYVASFYSDVVQRVPLSGGEPTTLASGDPVRPRRGGRRDGVHWTATTDVCWMAH